MASYLLQTGRLGFRRYVAADNQALAPVFADPNAAQFYPTMGSMDAIDRWIGWHIHPAFRSLGYATEAGKACLAFGFKTLQAPLLGSIVDPANAASIKVALRVHQARREYKGKNGPMLLYYTDAL